MPGFHPGLVDLALQAVFAENGAAGEQWMSIPR
jgi:hypothetical protein